MDVNLTPMIDCMFQLLVFFLLSSSFQSPAVSLELPKSSANHPTAKESIVVTLDANDRLFLNQRPVAHDELRGQLTEMLSGEVKPSATLKADRSVVYEKVLDVLMTMRSAGAEHVNLSYERGREQ